MNNEVQKKGIYHSTLFHMLNSQLSEMHQLFGYSSNAIYSQRLSGQFNDVRSYAGNVFMYCLQLSILLYEKSVTGFYFQ
jgi:hypothetical protein